MRPVLRTRAAIAFLGGVQESDADRDYIDGIREILAHIEDEAAATERRLTVEREQNARIVAEYWRDEMMKADGPIRACAHPCAMILTALDGETDPVQMGIPPDEYARRRSILQEGDDLATADVDEEPK